MDQTGLKVRKNDKNASGLSAGVFVNYMKSLDLLSNEQIQNARQDSRSDFALFGLEVTEAPGISRASIQEFFC